MYLCGQMVASLPFFFLTYAQEFSAQVFLYDMQGVEEDDEDRERKNPAKEETIDSQVATGCLRQGFGGEPAGEDRDSQST